MHNTESLTHKWECTEIKLMHHFTLEFWGKLERRSWCLQYFTQNSKPGSLRHRKSDIKVLKAVKLVSWGHILNRRMAGKDYHHLFKLLIIGDSSQYFCVFIHLLTNYVFIPASLSGSLMDNPIRQRELLIFGKKKKKCLSPTISVAPCPLLMLETCAFTGMLFCNFTI